MYSEVESSDRVLFLLVSYAQVALQSRQRAVPRNGLNMPQRYPSITHPGQCCSPKAVGASPLNADFVERFPKYLICTCLVNMSSPMPPWKQIVLAKIWLVFLKISPERWVNLYLPSISFSFGIETTQEQYLSNAIATKDISGKQSAGFINPTSCIETHAK
jgi:hypothetical protein